jgi:hypothetical protein
MAKVTIDFDTKTIHVIEPLTVNQMARVIKMTVGEEELLRDPGWELNDPNSDSIISIGRVDCEVVEEWQSLKE